MKHILLLKNLIVLGCGVLMLSGCSSTPSKFDTGRIKARTFSFIGSGVPSTASFADNREQVHVMIQQALAENLAAKGLTQVTSGGEVTVAYLVIIGNNASTEAINQYFGYGRDASALHDKAHKAYTSSKNPNYFEAGTLVVDFVDAKTFKLLRRTHVTRPVLRNPSVQVRAANIQEAVNAALKGLKIAP